jgi:hypothetical protein
MEPDTILDGRSCVDTTWISLPSSLQAKTTISGLTPLTTVMVRHCAVTKAGPQDWSQPISAVVQ